MKKITAIYVRRSVSDKDKGNNSLSIESQKADCIRFLKNGGKISKDSYRIYCDNGKSGKDIAHRPSFQQMMSDAREGIIDRIIVKKYDRFSRNMREYLNITDELDKYGVSVISLSEPFNTETKEGRMMRNNLLNFAEFERETIAARVADAYLTRSTETGFFQGGKEHLGFKSERRTVNGKTGSVLVPSEQSNVIITAFEMYKEPSMSLQGIINYFRENKIDTSRKTHRKERKYASMCISSLAHLLNNPIYVRADVEVYKYLVSKGYRIIDDIEAFDGIHGLFTHRDQDGGRFIKVGYHEGLISSETWLTVQDKRSHHMSYPSNRTAVTSWLMGLVKCAHCGYAVNTYPHWNKKHTIKWRYFRDSGAYNAVGCVKKNLDIRPDDLERIVFEAMKNRLDELTIIKREQEKPDFEIESIKAEIARVETEIHQLMDKLAEADTILFDYIQKRIKELHSKKSDLEEKLNTRERKKKTVDTEPLIEPLSRWNELTNGEKNEVAATMIDVIRISDETGIDIQFSI